MAKVSRPPAEKKRLSYERDGRNTYGQNNKASRRRIAAFKAASNRAMRHAVTQTLKAAAPSSDVEIERADAAIADQTYVGLHPSKRKVADEPLGTVLAKKRERAPTKVNAKNIRRTMREANKD